MDSEDQDLPKWIYLVVNDRPTERAKLPILHCSSYHSCKLAEFVSYLFLLKLSAVPEVWLLKNTGLHTDEHNTRVLTYE